jgi:hypothetical protein
MEFGEGVAANLPLVEDKDKCPICEKAKHETTKKAKPDENPDYKSKPKELSCVAIPQASGAPNYATAAHHLICVNECFLPYHRLSQMAWAVGYNVNAPRNGLSLPTVGQRARNSYATPKGPEKFGDIKDETTKLEISEKVMAEVDKNVAELEKTHPTGQFGAQWHVGPHNWSDEEVATNTDDQKHGENYESEVNKRLKEIEDQIVAVKEKVCEPDENGERGKRVADALNSLSDDIKKGIKKWNRFFVSRPASIFGKRRGR